MHEVAIAQEIIDIVKGYLPKDKETSVKSVKIALGDFSNVMPEALVFGFQVLIEDTELKGAELEIDKIPLTVKCNDCDSISTLDEPLFFCLSCKGGNVKILTGTELDIIEIEFNN